MLTFIFSFNLAEPLRFGGIIFHHGCILGNCDINDATLLRSCLKKMSQNVNEKSKFSRHARTVLSCEHCILFSRRIRRELTAPALYSTYSSRNTSSPVMDSNHFASNKPWQIPTACTLKKQARLVSAKAAPPCASRHVISSCSSMCVCGGGLYVGGRSPVQTRSSSAECNLRLAGGIPSRGKGGGLFHNSDRTRRKCQSLFYCCPNHFLVRLPVCSLVSGDEPINDLVAH